MQGLEDEKLHKSWIASSVKPFFSEGIQKQVKQVGKNDETGVHESWGGAYFIKQEDRNAYNKVVGVAANEVMASSAKEILPKATKIEVWNRQARRMLGSRPNDAEETVDSKGNDVVEDIVVMDYAQPHRKPPIHNIEP
ncbi:hypothetical protein Acr_00g0035490 [Actinidia rufa]|uniref:Uncharacterized protein n=1 Tax=Actinidia rufa TaxID=165716 RepID=A0A7J0DG94_9ERIC|nr:hypothetical protein Acr_00g0035490 [Actinidia rufa]